MNQQTITSEELVAEFKKQADAAYEQLSNFTNEMIEKNKVPVQFVAAALSRELSLVTSLLILGTIGPDREKAVGMIESFCAVITEGTIDLFDDMLANGVSVEVEQPEGQPA